MTSMQSIKTQLESMREELAQRVEAIEADTHHKNEPVEKDFAEQVTQRENDDVLAAIDQASQQTIRLIDAALLRIANGNYGICSKCHEEISSERLKALPYATTCINCSD